MTTHDHSSAHIFRHLLIQMECGTDPNADPLESWPIYVAKMDDEPDNMVCCYDSAGELFGRVQNSGKQLEDPGIQVVVRGIDYPTASARINLIQKKMEEVKRTEVEVDGTVYRFGSVRRTSGPFPFGFGEADDRNRERLSINFLTTITEV